MPIKYKMGGTTSECVSHPADPNGDDSDADCEWRANGVSDFLKKGLSGDLATQVYFGIVGATDPRASRIRVRRSGVTKRLALKEWYTGTDSVRGGLSENTKYSIALTKQCRRPTDVPAGVVAGNVNVTFKLHATGAKLLVWDDDPGTWWLDTASATLVVEVHTGFLGGYATAYGSLLMKTGTHYWVCVPDFGALASDVTETRSV